MSFELWGGVWIGCAVMPIVAAVFFKAKNWRFCLGALGIAVGCAMLGSSTPSWMSWLWITIATGTVALELWKEERSVR